MKSAKEWAAEVVDGPEWGHAASSLTRRDVVLGDDEDYVMVYSASTPAQRDKHCEGCVAQEELIGIIERLVERVQADARAPLEEEIARLRAENERLNAEHAEYREFIAGANDMLAEEHEQARRLNE